MRLGMMNDPRRHPADELRWAAEHGLDFIDLTLEGPGAALETLDLAELSRILKETGLGVVGHTAIYLPFTSPLPPVRRLAVVYAMRCLEALATLGARWMNVHLMSGPRLYGTAAHLEWNRECFAALAERGDACGVGVMVEHPPTTHFSISDIAHVLAVDERLGFHLDVGHANVGGDRLEGMLNRLGSRLAHVHLSDNGGRSDDHLPLGAGTVNWPRAIRLLRESGYDDTITLEVFSPDRDYLLRGAQKVRQWWAEAE